MTAQQKPEWQLGWWDLLWILAYPLYQVFGTARHELSHAAAASMEGADVTKIVLWPQTDLGRFTWGYTQWQGGNPGWFTDAAPYLCDLIWFAVFFFILTRISFGRHWIWLNLMIIGLLSPLINSFSQWLIGIFGSDQADVAKWLDKDPDVLVHGYFLITLTAYVLALLAILWLIPRKVADAILPSS
jgi:hypothetical protein